MIGSYYGLSMMLMNFLRIPPGIQVRKSYGIGKDASSQWYERTLASHDFINTVVDITADDVCIGNSPLYLEFDGSEVLSPRLEERYKKLVKALNKVVRWVAVDLLKRGFSVYVLKEAKISVEEFVDGTKVKKDKIIPNLVPVLEDVEFYMDNVGMVHTLIEGEERSDVLVFLNYSKETLSQVPESHIDSSLIKKFKFQITPEPIQLKHVESVAKDLYMVERAIVRYRVQLSRIVRFAEVEVGVSMGGENNDMTVDNASAAVNANSMSLGMTAQDPMADFDDNLPINPVRKGVGHIEVQSDIPDFDKIKDLPDLDYILNRLFLAMRFPKSYADFGQNLNDSAVSLIRGDIRYSRMADSCRSIIQDTVNCWIFGIDFDYSETTMSVKLATLPNSEDDDVVEALSKYSEFVNESFQFIDESESKLDAEARLNSLVILLGDTANIPAIQKWVAHMRTFIEDKFAEEEVTEEEEVFDMSDDSESDGSSVEPVDEDTPEESGEAAVAESPEDFDLPPMTE